MDRTERFYLIERLLGARRSTPRSLLLNELGVSWATLKRDLDYLRNRLNAPIVFDRGLGGYRFEQQASSFELPGLWFNASEAHALLTLHSLLTEIQPGLLSAHIEPLKLRLGAILASAGHAQDDVKSRIRMLTMAARQASPASFEVIAHAVLARRQLLISHYNRASDALVERTVSPQRLVYYRDNWYLDAWCHSRDAIRSFALDAIRAAQPLSVSAVELDDSALDAELGSGYGIFSGAAVQWAQLKFSATRARWVAQERWHKDQRSRWLDSGEYVLELPYADARELLMDILRHGGEVEVLAPPALRQAVQNELAQALARYRTR
jgi:predicted DNA-binding transcriptional regulator YafY